MVVDQVHVHGFAILESEHDTPVSRDSHAPHAGLGSLQWMESKAWRIGVPWMICFPQPEEDSSQSRNEGRGNSGCVVVLIQCPKTLVPDSH